MTRPKRNAALLRHWACRVVLLVSLLALFLLLPRTVRADMANAWTTAREVHLLNPAEAAQKEAVHLTGVVTALSGWKDSFFMVDGTSGMSVNRSAVSGPAVSPGDRVVVDGVTDPGAFAPHVVDARVTLLRHGALPPARLASAAELAWGVQDSQWLQIEGEVHSVERKVVWNRSIVVMSLNIGGPDLVTVHVVDPDNPVRPGDGGPSKSVDWSSLNGATVRLRGVCGSIWNDRRQFIGIRFFVESIHDITVERPAPPDPFQLPFRHVNGLLQYSRATGGAGQVKLQGVVSAVRDGSGFYLQDATGAAFIRDKTDVLHPGALVEVAGFPSMDDGAPLLQAAHVRQLGNGTLPVMRPASADDVIVVKDGFTVAPYDSMLVELSGTLLDVSSGEVETTLLLKSGNTLFRALLPLSKESARWKRGSVLGVTGVCDVAFTENKTPDLFRLRLRSVNDVVVVRGPSWWTSRHAIWLCSALGALAAGLFGWITFLHRRDRLRELIWTDPLTGLYNRRAFLLLAEKQIELLRRKKGALLLFYIDLDGFKEINDTFGHRAGDGALKDIAAVLRRVFRESDVLCRLGGDEFAVFANDVMPRSEATLKARLNEAVLQDNQRTDRGFRLSLSVGALYCDAAGLDRSIEDLLEHADGLMYGNKRGKKQGTMVPVTA